MTINEIENKIARGEMTAMQVFTQMKQHTNKEPLNVNGNKDLYEKAPWWANPDLPAPKITCDL